MTTSIDHEGSTMTYLVIGATGNVGGELVPQLLQQGHKVRALVRDASRAERLPVGTGIAVGDLDDAESLTAAARGVDGVFYMQLAPLPAQAGYMVQAAKAAGVSKIVLLSSLGTVLHPLPVIGARIAARDEVFRQSGLDVTYLRANGLMSNALWWVTSIRDEGRVLDATDPGRQGVVDPYDVARIGALALTQDGHAGRGYILNGPQALTAREQAETLAEVLGRAIEFVPVTPREFARRSVEHGTPAEMASAIQNLNELFRADRAGVLADDITNLTGVAPRTFREWAERHADAFK
jgi:uncharacterized protein YbjT (DUF2867 family)